ncbi:efflux RND transporter periplasmic adaptor subunit [Pseudogulbenkiania sp. MAI-1]|uniref:efflux RND transporter periplasmic adaptor subunit n=1 Tax=Pseudogulbenkiania sp. MAI-1 TaxID=990370 RepID=UPI00045E8713|nr:HlyD family efflux transporter periplasmic adaptor subunit [Pseudogulbenkiania sp. MAI-1]
MRPRARIGIVLLALAVAGGLALGFFPQAVTVDTVAVGRGPLAVTVEEEGKTRVIDRYVVSAPVTGYVRRIDLRVGDAVRQGQVLAVIEPARSEALDPRSRAQAAARVRAAEAAQGVAQENAQAARAQAQLARQELTRAQSLRKSNFISEQALDQARAEVSRSEAVLLAAEHAVRVARFDLDVARAALAEAGRLQAGAQGETIRVLAPQPARVLKVTHESEGPVQAGQTLIEIGDPERLEVEVEVLSTQAVSIAPTTKVLFSRWGGGTTLQGAVRVIEPAGFTKVSALGVEEQRVRVIVDFTSPREEWRRLGDGYRVEARFVVWEGSDVMQIPASALFRQGSGWAVFVVRDGRARLKTVQVGQRAGLAVQITSGLAVGEQVISHPDDKIDDGVRVKPATTTAE